MHFQQRRSGLLVAPVTSRVGVGRSPETIREVSLRPAGLLQSEGPVSRPFSGDARVVEGGCVPHNIASLYQRIPGRNLDREAWRRFSN
jgi:hypothetical protein